MTKAAAPHDRWHDLRRPVEAHSLNRAREGSGLNPMRFISGIREGAGSSSRWPYSRAWRRSRKSRR